MACLRRDWTIKLRWVAALLIGFAITAPLVEAAGNGPVKYELTILHNNDGESQLVGDPAGYGGISRFKSVVDRQRLEVWIQQILEKFAYFGPRQRHGVVLLSSGDNYLAGPEFSVGQQGDNPFYDALAIGLLRYNALAIGNHEFDFGPDIFADFLAEMIPHKAPAVSANLDFSEEPRLQELVDSGRIAKSVVIVENGEKIGIVGATTPRLATISSPRNVIILQDVTSAVQAEIDALLADRVNKIIFISHLQSILEDQALLETLSGVDVAIAGGGDELLANPGTPLIPGDEGLVSGPYPLEFSDADGKLVPVITTSGSYRYLGRLTVGFDKWGNVVEIDPTSGPIRVAEEDGYSPALLMNYLVELPVMQALEDLAANVIAQTEVPLDGRRPLIRTEETNLGNLIADSYLATATALADDFGVAVPDVALANGGGIRNDDVIPVGPVTELDTFNILPFGNFICVVPNIPREQFKQILENCVSRVEFTDGRFAQIAGFSMEYDPAGTPQLIDVDGNITQAGSRVVNVMLDNGEPIIINGAVVPGDPIAVATVDFLARGGDQYPFMGAAFTSLGVVYQQALRDFIVDNLGGVIPLSAYPEGGEGRIVELTP